MVVMAMTGSDPIGRDLSRSRAIRRVAGRACVLCGERDAELLTQQPAAILEEHHVAGNANDPDLTVSLCLNCHRKMSARMPGFGVPLNRGARLTRLERAVGSLRGLAVFSEQLAPALLRCSFALLRSAFMLHSPNSMPERASLLAATRAQTTLSTSLAHRSHDIDHHDRAAATLAAAH